jgi:hypothetical protein
LDRRRGPEAGGDDDDTGEGRRRRLGRLRRESRRGGRRRRRGKKLSPPAPPAATPALTLPPATPLTARARDLCKWTMTAAASSLSSSRSPSAPSSSPAARLPAARLLRRPAAPRAVGGGEGDRAGVEVVADVDVLLRQVPEDGHRLLLRRRHDYQAQRPLLHRHGRVLRLQRHRRAAAAAAELQRQVRTRLFGLLPAGCTHEVIQDQ